MTFGKGVKVEILFN